MTSSMASRVADALHQAEDRLVDHRHQDAVGDEAGVVVDLDGVLPSCLGQRLDGCVGRVAGREAADTSTSFISGTGFMKCMPMKRSGRFVAAASSVIEIDEVLVARIARRRQRCVERPEDVLLERRVLDDGLDHEVEPASSLGTSCRDARERRRRVGLGRACPSPRAVEAPLDVAAAPRSCERAASTSTQRTSKPPRGEHLGDAVAHRAGRRRRATLRIVIAHGRRYHARAGDRVAAAEAERREARFAAAVARARRAASPACARPMRRSGARARPRRRCTFTRAGSELELLADRATAATANASFISMRSTSSSVLPVFSHQLLDRVDRASSPLGLGRRRVALGRIRASGFSPARPPSPRRSATSAAAPSLIWLALPAVTVPSGRTRAHRREPLDGRVAAGALVGVDHRDLALAAVDLDRRDLLLEAPAPGPPRRDGGSRRRSVLVLA